MIRNVAQELINACFEEVSNDRVRMEGFGGGGGGGNGVSSGVSADFLDLIVSPFFWVNVYAALIEILFAWVEPDYAAESDPPRLI